MDCKHPTTRSTLVSPSRRAVQPGSDNVPTRRVVICGAGIIGASIAYYLSRHGISAQVFDRTGIACAASGWSSNPPAPNLPMSWPMRSLLIYSCSSDKRASNKRTPIHFDPTSEGFLRRLKVHFPCNLGPAKEHPLRYASK